jgi:hypothetical protein
MAVFRRFEWAVLLAGCVLSLGYLFWFVASDQLSASGAAWMLYLHLVAVLLNIALIVFFLRALLQRDGMKHRALWLLGLLLAPQVVGIAYLSRRSPSATASAG